jgi:hypothetical protein
MKRSLSYEMFQEVVDRNGDGLVTAEELEHVTAASHGEKTPEVTKWHRKPIF